MYVPGSFEMSDPADLQAFMRAHGFATLVTSGENGPTATHLPVLLDAGAGRNGTLLGHVARANPQWRHGRGEAMVVFAGPHAYVSPTWYETPGTVPTWNYVAVHAYGTLRHRRGRVDGGGVREEVVSDLSSRRHAGRWQPGRGGNAARRSGKTEA